MTKNPKRDDLEQSKRFVETVKELGTEETGKRFEEAIKVVTPACRVRPSAKRS